MGRCYLKALKVCHQTKLSSRTAARIPFLKMLLMRTKLEQNNWQNCRRVEPSLLLCCLLVDFNSSKEQIHRTSPIVLTTQPEIRIQLVAISKIQKDHPVRIRTNQKRIIRNIRSLLNTVIESFTSLSKKSNITRTQV